MRSGVLSAFFLLFVLAAGSQIPVFCAVPAPPVLQLGEPQVSGLTVTVNGVALPGYQGATITRISWDWGDGYREDHWFPGSHTYRNAATYSIAVTAYQNDGRSTTSYTVARPWENKENYVDTNRFYWVKWTDKVPWDWCGPLAVANVINYYLGEQRVTPQDVVSYEGSPPYWPNMVREALDHFARKYGLEERAEITSKLDVNKIIAQIDDNRPVVLFSLGGGPWILAHNTIILGYAITLSAEGRVIGCALFTYDYGWVNSDNVGIWPTTITFKVRVYL